METPPLEQTEEDARRDLILFHQTGRRPAWAPELTEDYLPVLMHGYRDASRLRSPYPIVLAEDGFVSLSEAIDALLEDSQGDEREKLARDLHRLERSIRSSFEHGEPLSDAWERGIDHLLRGTAPPRRTEVSERLHNVQPRVDGPLLDCTTDAIARLFTFVAKKTDRSALLREKISDLRSDLQNIAGSGLKTRFDDSHSEIDAGALEGLIKNTAATLSPRRRLRIQIAEKALEAAESQLFGQPLIMKGGQAIAELRNHLSDYWDRVAQTVRALRVAELEAANRYREEKHDALFERFGWGDVLPVDLLQFDPPLVVIDTAEIDDSFQPALLDLLATNLPLKLLLIYDRALDYSLRPASWTRFALTAAVTMPAFVFSGTAAALPALASGMEEALAHDGASLVCVFRAAESTLPPYLAAAAAQDARLVPSFRYAPAAGTGWASRFTVAGNTQPELVWPSEAFDGQAYDFTAADFAACDRRFYGHFALVDVQKECMSMLSDWLASPNGRVPFIVVVDQEGNRRFAVMTRHAAALAAVTADSWSRLRELGGIENSYVRKAVDAETARLLAEKKRALEEADARFSEDLERAASGVAEEIVSYIAAGLLHLNGSARPAAAPKPAPKPVVEAAATVEAPVVVAEEEDDLSLDEAYIDTPLCTSCNECTNLNSLIFGYNADKQAYIKDAAAGPYADLVKAAELCPVHIVHPGRPKNPAEAGLDQLLQRAQPFL